LKWLPGCLSGAWRYWDGRERGGWAEIFVVEGEEMYEDREPKMHIIYDIYEA
jgi:hypothetical protein